MQKVFGFHFGCQLFYEENNNENELALWLVLKCNFERGIFYARDSHSLVDRLIREFFIAAKRKPFDEDDVEIDSGSDEDDRNGNYMMRRSFASTVENLYKHLGAAHAANDCSDLYTDEYIQHESLQVKLKPYQVKTIKWMLSREVLVPKYHTSGFIEIKRRSIGSAEDDDGTKFFYNPTTCNLTTDPDFIESHLIPTGGILAEEMGMGKTIEVLDLILLNPRPLDKSQLFGSAPPNTATTERPVTKADLKCLCMQTKTTDVIWCTKCLKVQHRKCVDQQNSEITPDTSYICPGCWESEQPICVKTTFIVSPQSIKMQWNTEIEKRIQSGTISVSVYREGRARFRLNADKICDFEFHLNESLCHSTVDATFFCRVFLKIFPPGIPVRWLQILQMGQPSEIGQL